MFVIKKMWEVFYLCSEIIDYVIWQVYCIAFADDTYYILHFYDDNKIGLKIYILWLYLRTDLNLCMRGMRLVSYL